MSKIANKNSNIGKKILGRGLSDLFTDRMSLINDGESVSNSSESHQQGLLYLDISFVKPCPTQPRKIFDQEALGELADSIKEYGVMQPIVVKQKNEQGFYEIIAGERRWKASILAGQKKIPALVKSIDDHQAFLLSIIENLQRADLSPIEEAEVYERLVKDGYTHDQIASMLSKSRSYISNTIRLINLSKYVKDLVNSKSITIGHAKILLGFDNQDKLADEIIEKKMNIRETEDFVRKAGLCNKEQRNDLSGLESFCEFDVAFKERDRKNIKIADGLSNVDLPNDLKELEKLLSEKFGVKVEILNGKLVIHYKYLEGLDKLIAVLMD